MSPSNRFVALLVLAVLSGACDRKDRDEPSPGARPAAPVLNPVTSPVNGASAALSGSSPAGVLLTVSGGASTVQTTADAAGRFAAVVPLRTAAGQETVNELEVVYALGGLASDPALARVVHDPVAPGPPDFALVVSPTAINPATLTGTAEPNAGVTVTGGAATAGAWAGADGSFSVQVPLVPNAANALSAVCADAAGNVGAPRAVTVVHDDVPPAAAAASLLRAFFDGVRLVVEGNFGAVEPGAAVTVRNVTTMGLPVAAQATAGGSFSAAMSGGANGNLVEVTLADAAGNASLSPHTTVTASLAWNALSPAGTAPTARVWAAAEYDLPRDRVLVFGGLDAGGATQDVRVLSLAPGSETWSAVAASSPPAARCGMSLHFDAPANRMIVFGGTDPAGPVWFQDLQALSLLVPGAEAWTALAGNTPPAARAFHASAFDSVTGMLYVYGGLGAAGTLGDLWQCELHAPSPVWAPITASGTVPPPLSGACAALDAPRSRLLLFGGRTQGGTLTNYVYTLDLASVVWARWSIMGTPPTPREGAAAVLDPAGDRWFVFGGDEGALRANDLHVLDLVAGGWTTALPGGTGPAAREGACLAFDSRRLHSVLFGGSSDGSTGTFFGDAQVLR